MIPTSTFLLPGCVLYEPDGVAPIICMSHWLDASGSALAAFSGARRAPPWACSGSSPTISFFGPGGPLEPIGLFAAAPTSSSCAAACSVKSGALERTVATPTWAFSSTIEPPAASIASRAAEPAALCS